MYTRKQFVDLALSYNGVKQGSKKHKDIVNKFNALRIAGQTATYKSAWCDIFATVMMSMAGFTSKNAPFDWNCGNTITKAKKLGLWIESDSYVPKLGTLILYDWEDSGKGDNTGTPNHIGICATKNVSKKFNVIEGNKGTSEACGIREMSVNGKFIRGYIELKGFADEKKEEPKKKSNVGKTYKIVEPLGLNIRDKASTKGKKLGAIPKGKKVVCKAESGVWIKVKYGKVTGWICTKEGKSTYAKVV